MPSRSSSQSRIGHVDALDFDSHRKLPSTANGSGASSPHGLLRDDESLLSNVVEGIIERDRRKMKRQVTKYLSFASAILSWYGPATSFPCPVKIHCPATNMRALSIIQSLRRLYNRLLRLWPPLPLAPPLYAVPGQCRLHHGGAGHVSSRPDLWLLVRSLLT